MGAAVATEAAVYDAGATEAVMDDAKATGATETEGEFAT